MAHPPTFERRGMGGHHATVGASDDWLTPPAVFEQLGVEFDLDVCASRSNGHVPARYRITLPTDGLTEPWTVPAVGGRKKARVWCNPPYTTGVEPWLERLAAHGDGIALVFARTDTRWFQRIAPAAAALLFHAGRLTFLPGPGNPGADPDRTNGNGGAPSVFLAFGDQCAQQLLGSRLAGLRIANPRPQLDGPLPLWSVIR